MADPYILSLPPNDSEEFGRAIAYLAERVLLPSDPPREAIPRLALHLTNNKTRYFSSINQWVKGRLDDPKKPLTDEHWFNLVTYFWRKPGGLSCREEVEHLACCGGIQLVSAMQDDKRMKHAFQQLFETLETEAQKPNGLKACIPLDPRYPTTGLFVDRPELDEIWEMIADEWYQNAPLVLLGLPGIGKTVLLRQLLEKAQRGRSTKGGLALLSYGVLYCPLNQGLPYSLVLEDLARQAGVLLLPQDKNEATILFRLRERLHDLPSVLILDGVADAEMGRRLMVANMATSPVIITTNSSMVAHELVTSDENIVSLAGFDAETAITYFQKVFHKKASAREREAAQELVAELDGNPAALTAALKIADQYSFSDTVRLVRHAADEPLTGLIGEVFKPKVIAYQNLRSDIYRLRLNALSRATPALASFHSETIAAIFDVKPEVGKYVMNLLEEDTGLVHAVQDSAGAIWEVDPLAKRLAEGPKQLSDMDWEKRALQTEYIQRILTSRQQTVTDLSWKAMLSTYQRDREYRRQPLLWKIWLLLTRPDLVPNRLSSNDLLTDLPDHEYLEAAYLTEIERHDRRRTAWLLRFTLAIISLAFLVKIMTGVVDPSSPARLIMEYFLSVAGVGVVISAMASIYAMIKSLYSFDRYIDLQWALWRERHRGRA